MAFENSKIRNMSLEDFMAVSFSEAQIEAYHEKKRRAAYEKKQLILFRRQSRIAKLRLYRSVIIMLLAGSMFFYGVYLTTELNAHAHNISVMETELSRQLRENDDMRKRIDDSVDILAVRDTALSYGMDYPDAHSVIYYDLDHDLDYMLCIN